MTASNHVITGALIGAIVTNPLVALPLAFVTHFILDALPHYGINDHKGKKFLLVLSGDAGLAAAILLSLLVLQPQHVIVIVLSGIACASPDLMWLSPWVAELRHRSQSTMGIIRRFHSRIQWAEREVWWGIVSECMWFSTMVYMVARNLTF